MVSTPFKQTYTKEQALMKLKHYCAYQERCHQEVREKLRELGIYGKDLDEVTSTLIEENYLNEERFAIQFAGGKFRMKNWGKIKIRHELKLRQVSDYCIKKALGQIEEEAYLEMIRKLAEDKWESLKKEKNRYTKVVKTQGYLLQKGYESELAKQVTADLQ
jgi:regulatory protein